MYGTWPPFEDHGFRAYVDTFAARARSKATALSDEELSRTSEQDLASAIVQGIAPQPIVLREKDVATDATSATIVTFTIPFDGTADILKYRALEWNGDGTVPSATVEGSSIKFRYPTVGQDVDSLKAELRKDVEQTRGYIASLNGFISTKMDALQQTLPPVIAQRKVALADRKKLADDLRDPLGNS